MHSFLKCTWNIHQVPIPSHKTKLNESKTIKIMQNVFLDHNRIKLQASKRMVSRASPNTWKLTNGILNNPWDEGQMSKDLRNMLNKNKVKYAIVHLWGVLVPGFEGDWQYWKCVWKTKRGFKLKIHVSFRGQKEKIKIHKSAEGKKIIETRKKSMKSKAEKP